MSIDPVSTAALVVALVALLTTMSQVLAQLFATADGYRRCQESVMGPWAKLTRRRFRWSEMRFETRYTTPRFGLFKTVVCDMFAYPGEDYGTGAINFPRVLPTRDSASLGRGTDNHYRLDGSSRSIRATFIGQVSRKYSVSTEQVSWVMFLEALHFNSRFTYRGLGEFQPLTFAQRMLERSSFVDDQPFSMYDVTIEERSWDFMPAEVIRPLAVVSVSDIAIIARRLGMKWRQFDLVGSNLRAEGNGYTITSTLVRSVGIVLEITVDQDIPFKYNSSNDLDVTLLNELYIPSEIADKLTFGIVSGLPGLGIPDYNLGTLEEIINLLQNEIDPTKVTANTVSDLHTANPGWTPGISDIIGFASPMIRYRRSPIIRIPSPSEYVIGLTQQEEGFVVFHRRLRDLINDRDAKGEAVADQTRFILQQYEELKAKYGAQWEDQHTCNKEINNRSVLFLDDLHQRHDMAVHYLSQLQTSYEKPQDFRYTDLMYSHIRHAANFFPEALDRINANPSTARDHYGMRVAGWITEGAHIYFDNIPKIVKDMKEKDFDYPDVVESAWLTMMWKAFLWHRCHYMVDGERVPSSNYGSRLPIYIG